MRTATTDQAGRTGQTVGIVMHRPNSKIFTHVQSKLDRKYKYDLCHRDEILQEINQSA